VTIISAGAGYGGEDDAAISAKNQGKRAAFYGDFHVRAQFVQRDDQRRNISGAGMFFIRLGNLRFAISHVGDFKSGGLKTLDNSGGAECGRRALVAGRKRCGAGGSADDGDFPWLPDNLYGQGNSFLKVWCRSKSASLKNGRACKD
jgi:hypothetical protein